ncbi:MAG TPA: restriction endonuclease [bacterium]|nr:restriction endonuclease [bacterium]
MVNLYKRGRIAEKKVVDYLKKKRFRNIRRSKGSRGPADIYARKGGRKFYIQVKYGQSKPSKKEIIRLRNLARKRRGAAALIHRTKEGKIRWRFLGRWR